MTSFTIGKTESNKCMNITQFSITVSSTDICNTVGNSLKLNDSMEVYYSVSTQDFQFANNSPQSEYSQCAGGWTPGVLLTLAIVGKVFPTTCKAIYSLTPTNSCRQTVTSSFITLL
jgi:hypothetical protein